MNLRGKLSGIFLFALLFGACTGGVRQVSYQQEVWPILQANCVECHIPGEGEGYLETGLSMRTHADLMQGTIYGVVIVPGDSRHSIFNMLVEGRSDPSMHMPHGRESLDSAEIETLRLWVEQGALDN